MPKVTPKKPVPAAKIAPKFLQPYICNGMDIPYNEGDENIRTECPFCDGAKFFVNAMTGQFTCKNCGEGGNSYSFIRKLWEMSSTEGLATLAKERKLLKPETLAAWGVVKSLISGQWLIPGFSPDKKINNLYRLGKVDGKNRWLSTTEMVHQFHATPKSALPNAPESQALSSKDVIYICEGPWDAMALWEAMSLCKEELAPDGSSTGRFILTNHMDQSFLSNAAVIAAPGSNVFYESWAEVLAGKIVVLCFDSDHPKEVPEGSGRFVQPGYDGMKRVVSLLMKAESKPSSIHYINWGKGAESPDPDAPLLPGYDPTKPSGYDVRDFLSEQGMTPASRANRLQSLMELVEPIPDSWTGLSPEKSGTGSLSIPLIPCSDYAVLERAWSLAMKWSDGLRRAFISMLAVITSTRAVGDQVWIRIIGPASSGKSTLCEAVSTNKKYILAKSTMRGFHSGYKTDKDGDEDHSLLALAADKTLVTKDGDTLLQSPNFKQILAEARDVFDTTSRTHYRHAMSRNYENVRMTWILCGTSSLRSLDTSELGERFLSSVIMDGIDEDFEDEVLDRVIDRANSSMGLEANEDAESVTEPKLMYAMQLTGGYIDHLRRNANQMLNKIQGNTTQEVKNKIKAYSKFVSYLRARPSKSQTEVAEREASFRLGSQLTRLATCMAAALGREQIDDEVIDMVRAVALDTASGRTLKICRVLFDTGDKGASTMKVAAYTNESEKGEREMLQFLRKIKVVGLYTPGSHAAVKMKPVWKLTDRMYSLWSEVMGKPEEEPEEDPE